MQEIEKPFNSCYWVVPGLFLAGKHPTSLSYRERMRENLRRLLDAKIKVFIDLTEVDQILSYQELLVEESQLNNQLAEYLSVPIPDSGVPSVAAMKFILDCIDKSIEAGNAVYVHCHAGIGRTGTVVGCYLVRHGMTGEQAIEEIARLRQDCFNSFLQSATSVVQCEMVLNWQTGQ